MKKYITLLVGLLAFPLFASATVYIVPQGGTGQGSFPLNTFIVGNNTGALLATTSPTGTIFVATSTTASSTLPKLNTTSLSIGTLTGVLRGVGGYITTGLVDLVSDITGILGVSNGGLGINTIPSYGVIPVGNGTGYTLTATSSLGLVTSAITSLGPVGQLQTGTTQTLATSTAGTDFTITASSNTQTFNLPVASASNTGKLSSTDWSTFNGKVSSQWVTNGSNIYYTTGAVGIGTTSPRAQLDVASTNNGTAPLFQLSSVSSFATTSRFFVDSTGQVGIASSSRLAAYLTIQGASGDTNTLFNVASSTGNPIFKVAPRGDIILGAGAGVVATSLTVNTNSSTFAGGATFGNSVFSDNGFAGVAASQSVFTPALNASLTGQRQLSVATFSGAVSQGGTGAILFSPLQVEKARFTSGGSLGLATTTPNATLHVWGSMAMKRTPVAVDYVVATSTDYLIAVTSTASARTITLPLCLAATQEVIYAFKDESGAAGTNNITISRNASDTIDGATTAVINTNYGSKIVYCGDTGKWFTR